MRFLHILMSYSLSHSLFFTFISSPISNYLRSWLTAAVVMFLLAISTFGVDQRLRGCLTFVQFILFKTVSPNLSIPLASSTVTVSLQFKQAKTMRTWLRQNHNKNDMTNKKIQECWEHVSYWSCDFGAFSCLCRSTCAVWATRTVLFCNSARSIQECKMPWVIGWTFSRRKLISLPLTYSWATWITLRYRRNPSEKRLPSQVCRWILVPFPSFLASRGRQCNGSPLRKTMKQRKSIWILTGGVKKTRLHIEWALLCSNRSYEEELCACRWERDRMASVVDRGTRTVWKAISS